MCRDNSHHLLKYFFSICLCTILIPLLRVSNLLQNGHFFLFSAYFGGHFCYHSNPKSRINTRPLNFGYCSNKLIRRNLWRATFIFWPHRGAKIASKCTNPFGLMSVMWQAFIVFQGQIQDFSKGVYINESMCGGSLC